MQAVLILRHNAARAGDGHGLLQVKLQLEKGLPGVLDVSAEEFGVGISLNKGQSQGFAGIPRLEAGREPGSEEGVEPVEEDLCLGTHLAHEDGQAEDEGLGLENGTVDGGHVIVYSATAVFAFAGKTGAAG